MKLIDFQKITYLLAKEHKITIKEGERWAANIKNREVFYLKEDIYNLPEDHTLGLILHEIAHIHYSTDVTFPPKNQELMKATLNMIEDNSIEYLISKDYTNAAQILNDTKTEVLDTLIGMLPKMKNPEHEKALYYAAIKFEDRGYTIQTEKYEIVGEKIAKLMKQEKTLIYNRKKTKDLLPLCEKIIDLLLKELGELSEEDRKKMQNEEMHGKESTTNQKQNNKTIKRQVIDQLKAGNGWQGTGNISQKIHFIDAIIEQANTTGKKLRSILKRNNAMEFGGRFRTGKLKAKKIATIKTIKNKKPFTRKIVKSNKSYAFAIAADVSGSMFNHNGTRTKADYALNSLHMVAEALRIAGIPRSMIIFGENAITINPINKNQLRWEAIIDGRKIDLADNNGTNIHKAIKKGVEELNKIKTERKILITLTDGYSDYQAMEEEHKKATKQNIECINITIGPENHDINKIFGKLSRTIPNIKNNILITKEFLDILKTSIKLSQ